MNIFNEAIEAHAEWKVALIRSFNDGKHKQEVKDIVDSHLCELGQWIDGVGSKYAYLPTFGPMRHEHEKFHCVAGELVNLYNSGKEELAKNMLKHGGAFRQSSTKLVAALLECSRELDAPAFKPLTAVNTIGEILRDKTSKAILKVNGDMPVFEAAKIMTENNVGSLAVYDDGNFLGIFTERGFLQAIALQGLKKLDIPIARVADVNTMCVQRDDSIEHGMNLMTSTRTRHLPVMEDGRLIGIISIGDIVKKIARYCGDKEYLAHAETSWDRQVRADCVSM